MAEMILVVHRTRSPSLVDSVTVAFDQFRLFLLGKTVSALHAALRCACCTLERLTLQHSRWTDHELVHPHLEGAGMPLRDPVDQCLDGWPASSSLRETQPWSDNGPARPRPSNKTQPLLLGRVPQRAGQTWCLEIMMPRAISCNKGGDGVPKGNSKRRSMHGMAAVPRARSGSDRAHHHANQCAPRSHHA